MQFDNTSVTAVFILLGASVLGFSFRGIRQVLPLVRHSVYFLFWAVLLHLVIFFVFGYLGAVALVLTGHVDWVLFLTGVVFMFGALFVFLVVRVSWLTIRDLHTQTATVRATLSDLQESQGRLQEAKDKLELRVHERTLQLEEANGQLAADLAERKRIEAALRESEERYMLAVQGANDGLWDWNLAEESMYFAPRWKTMLGFSEAEIGTSPTEWLDRVHHDDRERFEADLTAHLAGKTAHFENEHRMKDATGGHRWMLSRGLAVRDAQGRAYRIAGSITDISRRKAAEDQLMHDALHDPLTGLPNRALFIDRLDHVLHRAQRAPARHSAVLFLDLDRFKMINDSLGHQAGDRLLVEIGHRLARCLRPGDTVARFGGDEFAVLLDGLESCQVATAIAERIQNDLHAPFYFEGHAISITASIGIASSCRPGVTYTPEGTQEILRDADTAMYRAKSLGKAQHALFDGSMHASVVAQLELEADLRRALERAEFEVFYQPIFSLTSQIITGMEALVRWRHPTRGLVMPGDFIPLAEETGLIVPIGAWVLRTACEQAQTWRAAGYADLKLAVNFSARQLQEGGPVETVHKLLQETGLPPQRLMVEITESSAMRDLDASLRVLQELDALGVHISIDDFGNSYSSLGTLKRFPFKTLKIDRTFLRDIERDVQNGGITRAILAMARTLNLHVIAEGVETTQQLAFLSEHRCEEMQGFILSKPVPAAEFMRLLESRPRLDWPSRRMSEMPVAA